MCATLCAPPFCPQSPFLRSSHCLTPRPSARPADFEDAPSFCPMRLIGEGKIKRMGEEFELVTFGLGQKRCIGEKMARAMICAFLGESLPYMDARGPEKLPLDNNLFDLIPASKLQLRDLRPRNPSVTGLS